MRFATLAVLAAITTGTRCPLASSVFLVPITITTRKDAAVRTGRRSLTPTLAKHNKLFAQSFSIISDSFNTIAEQSAYTATGGGGGSLFDLLGGTAAALSVAAAAPVAVLLLAAGRQVLVTRDKVQREIDQTEQQVEQIESEIKGFSRVITVSFVTVVTSLVFAAINFLGGRVTETTLTPAPIPSTIVASSEKVLQKKEYTATPSGEVNRLADAAKRTVNENVNVNNVVEESVATATEMSMQPNEHGLKDSFATTTTSNANMPHKDASTATTPPPAPPAPLSVLSVDAEFITVAAVGAASVSVGIALISKVGVVEQ